MTPSKSRAAPVRYSARTYAGSKVVEIAIGESLTRVLARARSHHRRSGQAAWVWNVRTGETVYQIGEVSIYAACA
jgi:hypothetical protein